MFKVNPFTGLLDYYEENTGGGGGGGISDGDKGDITVSGSGATWTIDDDVVNFAKMQTIATDRILGRATAGSGDIEELTAAQIRSIINVEDGAEANDVDSVNSQTGAVVLDADDIDDTSTTHKFVTSADITKLGNLSGTNTGDQDLSPYQLKPSEGAFVDGDKTKLDGIESGADVTDTANVTSAGALMDSEVTNLAQVKAFDSADYATAAQGALADTATQPGDLATVATSGDYGDLANKPTIPSALGDLTGDADDIDDTSSTNKFVTATDITKLGNLSGTNSGDVTVSDSGEIDFTLTGQDLTASIKAGSIDETKLDTSVNDSLDLADSAVQPGDLATVATSGDHTDLSNIGTNTHAQIDSHIADSSIHFAQSAISIPASQITDFDTEVSNNTDVAANTSARHDAVTLAGTLDYLTLSGQEITLGSIDLTTDVTGILPISNGGTGASTEADARLNLGLTNGGDGDIWLKRAGDIPTGGLAWTVADTENYTPFTLNLQDVTNNPTGLFIDNDTTGASIRVQQDGNGSALDLVGNATDGQLFNVYSNAAHTGGSLFNLNNDNATSWANVFFAKNDGNGPIFSGQANGAGDGIFVQNNGTGKGVNINQSSNSTALEVIYSGTTATAFNFFCGSERTGGVLFNFNDSNADSVASVVNISSAGSGAAFNINATKSGATAIRTQAGLADLQGGLKVTGDLGFYGTTPIAQQTTGVSEATFTENAGGTTVNDDSTFGGYTIGQVVQALQNYGLLA